MGRDAPTPLARKLGIAPGRAIGARGAPVSVLERIADEEPGTSIDDGSGRDYDVLLLFATGEEELRTAFSDAARRLRPDGGLWVAYPKRSSAIASDLSFAAVQRIGLEGGLVDNKSAAIDDDWTAVRFVVRLADRPGWRSR